MAADLQNCTATLWVYSRGKKKAYSIGQELVIGHQQGCQLQVKDRRVLAEHFKIVREEDGFHLCVFPEAKIKLNGEASSYAILSSDDEIRVGPYRFKFILKGPKAGAATTLAKRPMLLAAAVVPILLILGFGLWATSGSKADLEKEQAVNHNEPPAIAKSDPSQHEPTILVDKDILTPADKDSKSQNPEGQPNQDKGQGKDSLALGEEDVPEGDEPAIVDKGQIDPEESEAPDKNDASKDEKEDSDPESEENTDLEKDVEGPAKKIAGPAINLPQIQQSYRQLLAAKQYAQARKVLEDALSKANETQTPTLKTWLKSVDDAEWIQKKPLIAKEWKVREKWLDSIQEVSQLIPYLVHKQWSFRAIGAVGIVSKDDPRAIAEAIPSIGDKSVLVRSFVLKALTRLPEGRIKKAKNGVKIVETVIKEMSKNKRITYYSRLLLAKISGGEKHKTKSKWSRWLKNNKDSFKPDLTAPFDLTQFSKAELDRYQKELMAAQRAQSGGTVLRGDEFKSAMEDLRKNGLEVAICLDVTGSMGGVLNESKQKIETLGLILGTLVGNVRIGMVTYRDAVATTVPLTKNWTGFKKALDAQRASGGGDGPEGVEKGVEVCLTKMGWKKKSQKSIVIIADAPPHKPDLPRFEQLAKGSKKIGVVIHGLYPRAIVPDIDTYVKISGGKSSTMGSDTEFLKSFLLLIFGEGLEPYLTSFLDIYLEIQEEAKKKPAKKKR
jgi:hypothetical protein